MRCKIWTFCFPVKTFHMSKKTSWVLIPFAYDLENKQSYKSFFLSGFFIIYISEIMLPARMIKKTNRNRYVSFGKQPKKYTTKTNKQTKTSKYIVRIK